MIKIFNIEITLPPGLEALASPPVAFGIALISWLVFSLAVYVFLSVVLRALGRRLPGNLGDQLINAVRRPLFGLVVLFGVGESLNALRLPETVLTSLNHVVASLIAAGLAVLVYRVWADVFLPYAEEFVRKTPSRLDDVVVAITRLLLPIGIVFVAVLTIATEWGIDVGAALAAAGIVGIVVGLALQETLSNVFAGISILADEPFSPGELIVLPDGKVCKVEQIGLRTTRLYYVSDHSIIYMPNKDLANSAIANIFKPSYDIKTTVDVTIAGDSNLQLAIATLTEIAAECPNVVMSDSAAHVERVRAAVAREQARVDDANAPEVVRARRVERVAYLNRSLPKLEHEAVLQAELVRLDAELGALVVSFDKLEHGALTDAEQAELKSHQLNAIGEHIAQVQAAMQTWASTPEPLVLDEEFAANVDRWRAANDELGAKWAELRRAVAQPLVSREQRLDAMARDLHAWIGTDYKLRAEVWKDPQAKVKAFGLIGIELALDFFVDDARLEHFERPDRVATELRAEIFDRFHELEIEVAYQPVLTAAR